MKPEGKGLNQVELGCKMKFDKIRPHWAVKGQPGKLVLHHPSIPVDVRLAEATIRISPCSQTNWSCRTIEDQ